MLPARALALVSTIATLVVLPTAAFAQFAPTITGATITSAFQGRDAMERGAVIERTETVTSLFNNWGRRANVAVAGNVTPQGRLFLATTEWRHTYAFCPQGYALINNNATTITERNLGRSLGFISRAQPIAQDMGFVALSHLEPFITPEVRIVRASVQGPFRVGNQNYQYWGMIVSSRTLWAHTSHYIRAQPDLPWSYHDASTRWTNDGERFYPICGMLLGNAQAGVQCAEELCSIEDPDACTPPESTCGNLTCDEFENALTCPEDCSAPDHCPSYTVFPEGMCDEDVTEYHGDACGPTCDPMPPMPSMCGDGQLDGSEQCDDGNYTDGDGCNTLCMFDSPMQCSVYAPICGDGIVHTPEQCDDGNMMDGDGCSMMCTIEEPLPPAPVCGNGMMEPLEQCDDGNTIDGDGCSSTCTFQVIIIDAPVSVCGNGLMEFPEQCDDGNMVPGDGCSPMCTFE